MQANGPVLICPLNWGLGHAARCVPVVNVFLRLGWDVVVAGDWPVLGYLKGVFGATIQYQFLADVRVRYPSSGRFAVKLFMQMPKLLFALIREHLSIKRVIKSTGATLIISDNRYGVFSPKVKSIFMTHQLFIRAMDGYRWFEPVISRIGLWLIRRFDTCWVPDYEGSENLSGDLSHRYQVPGIQFIGPLSRFAAMDVVDEINPLPKDFPDDFILVLLSGPEPQRSILERMLYEQFLVASHCVVFVRGLTDKLPGNTKKSPVSGGLTTSKTLSDGRTRIIDFLDLPSKKMAYLIRNASLVISRPGYSTIMDLAVFGKKALLIPTPGQTEQEYLGRRMRDHEWALSVGQKHLHLSKHLSEAMQYKGIPYMPEKSGLLELAVRAIDNGSLSDE